MVFASLFVRQAAGYRAGFCCADVQNQAVKSWSKPVWPWMIPDQGIRLVLKRKMTTCSIEAAVLSVAIHLMIFFFGGSAVLWSAIIKPSAEFKGARVDRVELEKRPEPLPVNIQRLQRKLPPPKVNRMVSTSLRPRPIQSHPSFEFGFNRAGSTLRAMSLRRSAVPAKLDIGVSGVNFFGARSKGEKLIFILDASKQMMEDKKGGYTTYKFAKDEIHQMVDAMPSATLFNVMVYSGRNIALFRPQVVPATPENRAALNEWLAPINSDPYNAGRVAREYRPPVTYPSYLGARAQFWLKAVQAAMEQRADAIFVLCGGFGRYEVPLSDDGSARVPDPEKMAEYREKLAKVRAKAQERFDAENAARAKKGLPPKIVYDWNRYMRDELHLTMPAYPVPSSPRRGPLGLVLGHMDAVCEVQYVAENIKLPRVNFVYLVAKDSGLQREYDDTVMLNHIADEFRGSFKLLRGSETMKNLTY